MNSWKTEGLIWELALILGEELEYGVYCEAYERIEIAHNSVEYTNTSGPFLVSRTGDAR